MVAAKLNRRSRKRSEKGFTTVEVLVASSIALMSLGLVYTALIGMQISARTTIEQIKMRMSNQQTLKKLGRIIMQSTQAQVVTGEELLARIHVWRDEQAVWTPDTIEDDVEGLIYLDFQTQELKYLRDITSASSTAELIATDVEAVHFWMVGDAVFVQLTMNYDIEKIHDPVMGGTYRNLYASFAVRNNPRMRIGSSQ